MSWQVQEAKQRFSEVLRAAHDDGPQVVTKHGDEVAVVIDIAEYRKLTEKKRDVRDPLLGPPYLDDETASVFDEVIAERKNDYPRDIDFGLDE